MSELLAGVVLAAVALALILEPLVRRRSGSIPAVGGLRDDTDFDLTDVEESGSPKIEALLVLKEIEFDRETGKLSDEDYATMKATYQRAALLAIEREETGPSDMESSTETMAVCPSCGPRPESTAKFCSECGRAVEIRGAGARCSGCGTPAPPGAKYCGECGTAL
jgi:hypothetical protein